jgi:hypothetical protein
MMPSMPDLKERAPASPPVAQAVWPLPSRVRVHPLGWLAIALAILGLDLLTGPYIQVAILFVFPVAIATWSQGRLWGSALAIVLPLVRLPFFYYIWHVPSSWALESADTAVDVLVLFALAQMIDYIGRQRRELHVLEGMLQICGFCKRIATRTAGGSAGAHVHREGASRSYSQEVGCDWRCGSGEHVSTRGGDRVSTRSVLHPNDAAGLRPSSAAVLGGATRQSLNLPNYKQSEHWLRRNFLAP